MRDEKDQWASRDFANVYAVTNGRPADTAAFCKEFRVPFPCLVDQPGEPAYAAFGLKKVGMRQLFGPSLLGGLMTLAKRFREVRKPESGDVHQMSGTFVIGADGRILLAHADEHPNDRISSAAIWACLDQARA